MSKTITAAEKRDYHDVRFSDVYTFAVSSGTRSEIRLLKCLKGAGTRGDDRPDEDWIQMFLDEYDRLGSVNIVGMPPITGVFKNVVVCDANGAETDAYSIALELVYVEGERLRDIPIINDRQSLCPEGACRFMYSVAASLKLINGRTGMFQLDVSRRNIIRTVVNGRQIFTLIDFTGAWLAGRSYRPVRSSRSTGPVPDCPEACVREQALRLVDILREYADLEVNESRADSMCELAAEILHAIRDGAYDPLDTIITITRPLLPEFSVFQD